MTFVIVACRSRGLEVAPLISVSYEDAQPVRSVVKRNGVRGTRSKQEWFDISLRPMMAETA